MKYDFSLNMNERRSQTVLLNKVKQNSVVLELGPYKGVMTRYMKNTLGCHVYICELDKDAFEISRMYADGAWQGNLETLEWVDKFKDIKFDYILCADILEHLKNPADILNAVRGMLKDDGSVLLSVPNIAHNSVVSGLMQNRFDYTDWGILDRTHLRFYTYSSLKELCGNAGYTPIEEDAIYEPYYPPASMRDVTLNQEYGNVLQFIFELKKSKYVMEHPTPCVNKIRGGALSDQDLSLLGNDQAALKFIAFYLPQFHQIEENDKWWGEGFTEWTNTKKAVPLFHGHRQPRVPLDDRYYDLSDVKTLKWQAELMQQYHVYGLCFYHYWFNGKLLLERPMELLLENKDINMHYCISWANEPWTKNWDGGNREVLMPQDYGTKEDWKRHFDYLLPFFKDERYIKIDNKPLVAIYLSAQLEHHDEMISYWRQLAKENGFDGLYIAETLNAKQFQLAIADSDACIEFEPCVTLFGGYTPWNGHYFLKSLHVFFYEHVWSRILERQSKYEHREKFCGAFVDWDNSPRVAMKGSVCVGATPEKFKKYLASLVKKCMDEKNDRFIFINAWNEWCEGAYLEPDKDNGYGYLEAIKEIDEQMNGNKEPEP